MELHRDKCQLLRVTNKRKIIQAEYTIHNQKLTQADQAKYLGVKLKVSSAGHPHIHLLEVTHIYHPRIGTQVLHTFHQICDNEAFILPGYSKIVERTTTYRHHGPVDRGA